MKTTPTKQKQHHGLFHHPPKQQPEMSGGFPASASGGNGFTPITSSRAPSAFGADNSNNPSGAAGRSCFVLPHLGAKKKKRNLRVSSSAASTADQSSTADPFQLHDNDQEGLLNKQKSNNSRVDWYMEEISEEQDDDSRIVAPRPTQQQQQQQSVDEFVSEKAFSNRSSARPSNSVRPVTPNSSNNSNEPAPSLLQFPSPQDRSHEARRSQTRSSGMWTYQGEIEPEGVRGQEATVLTTGTGTSAATSNDLPLRSFDRDTSQSLSKHVTERQRALSLQMEEEDLERADQWHQQERQQLQQNPKPPRVVTPSSQQKQEQQRRRQPDPPQRLHAGPSTFTSASTRYLSNPQQRALSSNSFAEVVNNNMAEIAGQDRSPQQASDRQLPSGQRGISQREISPQVAAAATPMAAIRREEEVEHEPITPQTPEGQFSSSRGMASPEQAPQVTPTPTTDTASSASPKGSSTFRQSAPVNVDDSSFEDPMEHIQGIHAMAMEHVMRGEYDMALQAFTQVLQVYLEQHGRSHPLTASAYHNLGTVHTKRAGLLLDHTMHQRHCREQALLCFQAAARSARDCPQLGPNHPNVAVSLVRIGFLLLQSRQYQNAVITFEEALRIRMDHYGPTHGLVANLYNNLGVCHMHLQNFSVGRKYLQQALDIQKELLNQEDSETALLELADTLCNIGGLNLEWIRQQGPDARHALDAESAFLEALELRTKVLGEQHPLTNQVRSLHDMVRSIPLPKNGKQTEAPSQSYPLEYSPANVSEMTFGSSAYSRRSTPNHANSKILEDAPASDRDLAIPVLSKEALTTPERPSTRLSPKTQSRQATPVEPIGFRSVPAPKTSMTDYDATEESCLLKRPGDNSQSSGHGSSFVITYAQTTAGESDAPNEPESDRIATMRQAKAVLEAHRDFMDSPGRSPPRSPSRYSTINASTRTNAIDEAKHEDGILPLAGEWPEPKFDRISPEVLEDPVAHLHTIQNCAVSYMKRGRQDEAVDLFEMVVEVQKAKNGTVHKDVACALQNVGVAYLRKKEYYHALQAFEEAVRVRKGALGRDHPDVAVSLVKVGVSLLLLRRLQDSLWIFREALSVRKLALGSLHPSNARIYNNIGCVHVEFNELNEARRSFEAALDIQRNTLVSDPDNGQVIFGASTTLQNLGYLYAKRDMHEKAAMVLRESLSLQERIMAKDHQTVLNTMESLGEACLDARRFSHALRYYNELFERSQSAPNASRLKQTKILHKIAIIHEHQDDPKAQLEKLEMALRFVRSASEGPEEEVEALENQLRSELQLLQEELERQNEDWV